MRLHQRPLYAASLGCLLTSLLVVGCSEPSTSTPAQEVPDASTADTGSGRDAGPGDDQGAADLRVEPDADEPEPDSVEPDAGDPDVVLVDMDDPDVEAPDADEADIDEPDVAPVDMVEPDMGEVDADAPDADEVDADEVDADEPDMEPEPEPAPEPSGNQVPQAELFACDGGVVASPGRLRLVKRDEWRRNAGRWSWNQAARNPFEPDPTHRYESYTEGESIDEAKLNIFLGMLEVGYSDWATTSLGNRYNARTGHFKVVANMEHLACFVDAEQVPDEACVTHYVSYMLENGVLYRPPTQEEVDELVLFAQALLSEETSRAETVELLLSAARLTPGALFGSEVGGGEVDEHGRVRLTPDEIAHALTSFLDGRAPNSLSTYVRRNGYESRRYSAGEETGHLSAFYQAARDGSISNTEVIEALLRQYAAGQVEPDAYREDLLLESPNQGHTINNSSYWVAMGVRDFFRQWLGYDAIASQTPKASVLATSAYEGLGGRYNQSYQNNIMDTRHQEPYLVDQLDNVIARLVVEDEDFFRGLLTTRQFYVPGRGPWDSSRWMSVIYGVEPFEPTTRGERWHEMLPQERGGVLTHPAWLASHGHPNENDPSVVGRGKWVRENLLCQDVPAVPEGVDAMLDPETAHLSARDRVQERTEQPDCVGCHQMMNPLGYPFEIYNHAGYVRVDDHGAAPNGTSTLELMPDPALNGATVTDAIEMSRLLGSSNYSKRCFIRHSFRYFMGREETRQDACTLRRMEQAYDTRGSFLELLVALYTSDTFLYRWYEQPQGDQE